MMRKDEMLRGLKELREQPPSRELVEAVLDHFSFLEGEARVWKDQHTRRSRYRPVKCSCRDEADEIF